MNHILIIEDDRDIREGIRFLLEGAGYMVSEAPNGRDGLSLFDEDVDLVILDIMMPGLSGLQVCEEIRKRSYVPVLFLTARAKESDKLTGFMVGGDDYLVKPFSHAELFARVKALLRRRQVYDKEPGKVNEGTETLQCCASTADCTINEKNESRFDSAQRWLEINSVRINTVYNQVFIR